MLSSLFNEKRFFYFLTVTSEKRNKINFVFLNHYFRYLINIFHIIMAPLILIIKAAVFLMLTTFAYLSTDYDPTTADKRQ